ncbi:Integral membrane protein OS=Streptomyces antimycoticus OX=68175 GN=SSPO_079550 PE=4 SV=1 [Streptomyces antimycoticus]
MPGRLRELVLGGVWHSSSQLPMQITLSVAGERASAPARRRPGCARSAPPGAACAANCSASACYVGGGLGGAAVAGTAGSAWGVAAATVSGSAVWWLQLRCQLRERHHSPSPK